jgi:hypothetical protein
MWLAPFFAGIVVGILVFLLRQRPTSELSTKQSALIEELARSLEIHRRSLSLILELPDSELREGLSHLCDHQRTLAELASLTVGEAKTAGQTAWLSAMALSRATFRRADIQHAPDVTMLDADALPVFALVLKSVGDDLDLAFSNEHTVVVAAGTPRIASRASIAALTSLCRRAGISLAHDGFTITLDFEDARADSQVRRRSGSQPIERHAHRATG